MTLKKIDDYKSWIEASKPCLNPGHNPPSMISLQPGTYEYTCPSCGKKTTFNVQAVIC